MSDNNPHLHSFIQIRHFVFEFKMTQAETIYRVPIDAYVYKSLKDEIILSHTNGQCGLQLPTGFLCTQEELDEFGTGIFDETCFILTSSDIIFVIFHFIVN